MELQTKLIAGGIVAFLLYAEKQRHNDSPKIFIRKELIGGYNGYAAFPLGIFIKESEKDNKMLMDHEMIHWKQFQREGIIPFLINYSLEALKNGYDKNPYEIEARNLSGEKQECLTNYTDCVRLGIAETVNNPNFKL